jgi:hypothetical protein
VRLLALGHRVRRAAAQPPSTTTANIFTVTGGRIRIVQLIGEYTVAPGVVANTILAQYKATVAGSAAVALSIASAALSGAVKTSQLWLPAAPGSAMSSNLLGQGGQITFLSNVFPPGAVQITTGGSQTNARIQWDLYYVPVDLGVSVVAA